MRSCNRTCICCDACLVGSLCSVFLWIRLYSCSSRITTQIVRLFVLQPLSIKQQSESEKLPNCIGIHLHLQKVHANTLKLCLRHICDKMRKSQQKLYMKYERFLKACINGMHYALHTIYMHYFVLYEVCTVTSVV